VDWWERGDRAVARRYGALLVGLASVLVGAAGCGQEDVPEGTRQVDEMSEVGDCLGPDSRRPGGYVQRDCDDPEARGEIVDMVTDMGLGTPPICPEGTDELVDAEQGPVVDGDIASLPQTWCLRNIDPPHPGNAGMGGGELGVQDCIAISPNGDIVEVACDGTGDAPPQHRLLAITEAVESCPPGTVDPIETTSIPPRVYCGGAV
jgi:hypothetical protein